MTTSLELSITAIAAGGAGVGRDAEGRVVFVQRAAPGDRVEVQLVEARPRWARARLLRVLEPGPARRPAPCPHYERCGGCTLEHLQYGAQLEAKSRLASDALIRIGGVQLASSIPITGSPSEFRYRNRVTFRLRRLGNAVVAGFHELDRPAHVLDLDERCLLPEPAIAGAWGELRRNWGAGANRLPGGGSLRLTLRATAAGQVSLLVDGGSSRGQPDMLLQRVASLAAVWHRSAPGEEAVLAAGVAQLPESWGEEQLALSGGVFLQVNRGAAALLEAHVLRLAAPAPGLRVIDAYCGVGLLARRLAHAGALVTGIELDAKAIHEARRTAAGSTVFHEGRVEALLPAALPADLVILNPPRTGTDPLVLDALRQQSPARLIYVSCDPATLARDLARLGTRYRLQSLHCFVLFPQTAHVETVAELTCSTM